MDIKRQSIFKFLCDENSLAFLLSISFVIFAESVDKLMSESHELGGSTIAVDRATPKVCYCSIAVCIAILIFNY